MWTCFLTPRSMSEAELRQIAAVNLGETNVEAAIVNHRDEATKSKIEFEILWSDGECTWETWKTVHQLTAFDANLEAKPTLGSLAGRKRSGGSVEY